MRTVRRLYLYTVAFISLEVLIWGAIGLGRSILCHGVAVCCASAVLTQGLAGILVATPFFLVHWALSQRSARHDEEERASGVRAIFLYASLLATLIPIVQNLIALLDHLALQVVGLATAQAMFSPNQTWSDNLIAMVINAVFAAYFFTILRGDWATIRPREAFADVRRLYRFIWLAYSLAAAAAAVQQLLKFILYVSPGGFDQALRASGAHGIVLALVGVPLWLYTWGLIRASWSDPAERDSGLRLGVLYLFSLAGVVTVLASAGVMINVILHRLLGESMTLAAFISKISNSVSIGVPLAGIWAYYGGWLKRAIAETPDAPRRAGMRRLYAYILSAIGLGAAFTGLAMLLAFVVDSAFGISILAVVLRPRLAEALATLLVGLPLWWSSWRPLQAEALAAGDAGDHARRSLTRRIYLYLALFASVVGGMILAVSLLNLLLRSLFGSVQENLPQQALKDLSVLLLFLGLGLYHGRCLREDGRRAAAALAEMHNRFPVLVFEPAEGAFSQALLEAIHKQAPRLPVTVLPADGPLPSPAESQAVLLPASLALDPPAPLREWLAIYPGRRLAVPLVETAAETGGKDWFLAGAVKPLPRAAAQAAQVVRQWAEGQVVRPQTGASGWTVFLYIAAAILALELLGVLLSLGMSLLNR